MICSRSQTGKKMTLIVPVRTGHVVAPGCDTCHAFLDFSAYDLANPEVTRVTIGRVTRGMG